MSGESKGVGLPQVRGAGLEHQREGFCTVASPESAANQLCSSALRPRLGDGPTVPCGPESAFCSLFLLSSSLSGLDLPGDVVCG